MNIVERVRSKILPALERVQWLGPLLVRLSLGGVFITSGWGKLHNLGQVTSFFTELGIPFPGFNATLASSTELIGGVLILVGLVTRFAAIPLIFIMLVAIATAKRPEIDGVATLLSFIEFTYIAGFAWLLVSGPGRASLDALLFGRKRLGIPSPLIRPSASTAEQR
jgi:putative oxidoreductase